MLEKIVGEDAAQQLENPIWHVHNGKPPVDRTPLSFNVLLNLVSVCNTEDKSVLWGFILRYAPHAETMPNGLLDKLVGYAIRYYSDFVKPYKHYRKPSTKERKALEELVAELLKMAENATAEEIQSCVYEVGKRQDFDSLRRWFQILYEILLGQEQGPRMGSFIRLYGIGETTLLIHRVLAGDDLSVSGPAAHPRNNLG